jgi:hypothetical protein
MIARLLGLLAFAIFVAAFSSFGIGQTEGVYLNLFRLGFLCTVMVIATITPFSGVRLAKNVTNLVRLNALIIFGIGFLFLLQAGINPFAAEDRAVYFNDRLLLAGLCFGGALFLLAWLVQTWVWKLIARRVVGENKRNRT